MHDRDAVELVRRLYLEGHAAAEVARLTGVPRRTIDGWVATDFEVRVARGRHGLGEPCPLLEGLDEPAYAYLLGQYLGDGCIVRMRNGVYRLSISCCDTYPGIMRECSDAMAAVIPTNKVGIYPSTGCSNVTMYSLHWPCLFPQHGSGFKHLRPIVLDEWQEGIALGRHPDRLVRGLIHSDGCRVINRVTRRSSEGPKTYEYVRYFFGNESDDIKDLFQEACRRLGVASRPNSRRSISVARKDAVVALDRLVGPKY